MKKTILILWAVITVLPHSLFAHVELLFPPPMLAGKIGGNALKVAPFGAPNIDVSEAPLTTLLAGSTLTIEFETFIYHPGETVVLYTTDPEGKDVMPAMELESMDAEIPHNNLLYRQETPCRLVNGVCGRGSAGATTSSAEITLPNITGEVYLVVRQVMHDKFDRMAGGRISLKRIYYHQASRLNLVREMDASDKS